MVFLSVFWLNAFPHKHGISRTLSLRTVITGKHINYKTHCRIEFGQYVQTHEKHNNSMDIHTMGALALRPPDNLQGGYFFYSLVTGERLQYTHRTRLPMPDSVKDRVHSMARCANADNGLRFTDSDGNDLDTMHPDDDADDANDANYDPAADELSYESNEDPPDEDEQSLVSIDHPADPEVNEGAGNTAPHGNHSDSNSASDDSSASNDSNDKSDTLTPLTTYIDALEAELDAKIANLDSIYDPAATNEKSTDHDLSKDFEPIDKNGIQQSAREQTAADMDAPVEDNSDGNSAYTMIIINRKLNHDHAFDNVAHPAMHT
jgi:hypothetical protein